MRQVSVNSIGEYIREQREQAKISLRQLSQAAGVSNPYLSQIERGLRKPSAEILQQIAKGLRISAEAMYVQAGILEDSPADSGVRSALLADPNLTERQKQVLIEIYESFRKEGGAAAGPSAAAVSPVALVQPADSAEREPARDEPPARGRRRVRPVSPRNWAAATSDDLAGNDDAPAPAGPEGRPGAEGTGWPAAASPQTEE
ncbi:MAG TPA: helix-turn-helix transcriptional regulator [Streptosporangiaceae bacterium]|jgi:transcriptional regulator with XRE-family HTH domain